jgi:glutaminyl-peptide cyclotransferase
VGANNGAVGTAIVVQPARDIGELRRPPNAAELRFVLFDGEEPPHGLPEETTDFYATGLRGSRAYAARHARTTVLLRGAGPAFGAVLHGSKASV